MEHSPRPLRSRRGLPRHALLLGWMLPLSMLLVVLLVSLVVDRPVADITRDPLAVLVMPPYLGLLSNVGVLLWAGATAISLHTAGLLIRSGRRDDAVQFLVLFGLLSAILMLDDLFMLHEWFLPLVLGLPPWLMFAGEAVLLLVLLAWFRDVYRRWSLFFLGSAFGGFGISMAIDTLPDDALPGHYLLEDGGKFIGIANWLAFAVQASFRCLASPDRSPLTAR